jgi:hypothetical protein
VNTTMNLRELLMSEICDLPRKRDPNVSLVDQLETMHAGFVSLLKTGEPMHNVHRRTLEHLSLIESSSNQIRSAIKQYLSGSPYRASAELRQGLKELQPHLEMLVAPSQLLSNLYRVREIDSLVNSERKDIFHVPFDLRHRVNTQRYSISGWPSLYLGASLMVCWEEVGRPAFHRLAVACFDAEKSLNILDFAYRPRVVVDLYEPLDDSPAFFTVDYMASYLVCWPLLAACSVRAHHRGSSFVEEYIIPQLLLQWLRDESLRIDGIRYFSMRVNQTSKAPRLAMNYVFPVRAVANAGQCSQLTRRFSFTLPVPWSLLDGADFDSVGKLRQNEPYQLNSEETINYDDTIFGKLEARLNAREKQHLV